MNHRLERIETARAGLRYMSDHMKKAEFEFVVRSIVEQLVSFLIEAKKNYFAISHF